RRRAGGADLDPRIEPVRRATRGLSRTALRLRIALRAGNADRSDRDLPRALPSFGATRRTAHHAWRHNRRRRDRRRGAFSVLIAAAIIAEQPHRASGPGAAAG